MSVNNGDDANKDTFNGAFLSRKVDSDTVGKIDLKNTDIDSGAAITNIQKVINESKSGLITAQSDIDSLESRMDTAEAELSFFDSTFSQLSGGDRWFRHEIGFQDIVDLCGAHLSNYILGLPALPVKLVLKGMIAIPIVSLVGTGITKLEMSIGDNTDPERFMKKHQISGTPSSTFYEAVGMYDLLNWDNTNVTKLWFYATGANLDQLTAGQINIYFSYAQPHLSTLLLFR